MYEPAQRAHVVRAVSSFPTEFCPEFQTRSYIENHGMGGRNTFYDVMSSVSNYVQSCAYVHILLHSITRLHQLSIEMGERNSSSSNSRSSLSIQWQKRWKMGKIELFLSIQKYTNITKKHCWGLNSDIRFIKPISTAALSFRPRVQLCRPRLNRTLKTTTNSVVRHTHIFPVSCHAAFSLFDSWMYFWPVRCFLDFTLLVGLITLSKW